MSLHSSDGSHTHGQVDFGYDEDGIYIFKPTAEQYSDNFTELLALMEKAAGQVQGVVKVRIPNEWSVSLVRSSPRRSFTDLGMQHLTICRK